MNTVQYTTSDIDEVVQALKEGKVIAFPTDTVYGLGVSYYNEDALQRLKESKGRPDEKPIPTMVASLDQLHEISELNAEAEKLASELMPGALTLLISRRAEVDAFHTNGLDTIGVRMPDDAFILEMIQKLGCPMLVTSANLSGGANTFTTEQVLEQLDGRIDGIVIGSAGGDSASTIVNTLDGCRIVRPGIISEDKIKEVISK